MSGGVRTADFGGYADKPDRSGRPVRFEVSDSNLILFFKKIIMYQIEYEKTAIRTLARIPQKTATLIRDKIKQLAQNPFARNHNVTRLVGQDQTYRLRVGDWRVIYQIDQGVLKILVLKIGPRGDIYT